MKKKPWNQLYIEIRQWVQPYWRPIPPELIEEERQKALMKKNPEKARKKAMKAKQKERLNDLKTIVQEKVPLTIDEKIAKLGYRPSAMRVKTVTKPLHQLIKIDDVKYRPVADTIWFYHDNERHQILAYILPETGFRFTKEDRSDEERKQLKPMIRPLNLKVPYHRTHLIPFGYVGTENDPKLVIGWNGSQNTNELNDFEQRNKKRDEPIYWFVDIAKTKYGAVWNYYIFSVNDKRLIDSLTMKMGTNTQPVEFEWKD